MSLTPELMRLRDEIQGYARGFGLDFFETIYEVVDAQQINSLAAFGGFPVRYPHWRFGMSYDQYSKGHEWGLSKIYEMVINTDPSYAYLLSSNGTVDQKIVMAHVYGHVDFFKNNIWFSKTNRKMLDAMANHAVKIRHFMDELGQNEVESFIDACLAIENLIDPNLPFEQKKNQISSVMEDGKIERRAEEVHKLKVERSYMDSFINPPDFIESQKKQQKKEVVQSMKNPPHPMRDVMLFLMENAPLSSWEAEVIRIIRDESYYYVPQMQTKIMNEGWASYWHSEIMTKKALKDSEILDFAEKHSGVTAMQPGQLNPYKIGIELFRDIEDRWNKGKFGKEYDECTNLREKANWDKKLGEGRKKIFEVRRVCNDVTFIDQYLTEEFCERFKLYHYEFNKRTNQYEIVDRDYRKIKEKMLFQLTNAGQPFIYVVDGNFEGRGDLYLHHKHLGIDLDDRWTKETMRAIQKIWRRPVHLETAVEGQKKLLTVNAKHEFSEKNL